MENDILKIENFYAYYDTICILNNINLKFKKNRAISILGPSGCGKTTLLRCINRMHELADDAFIKGKILLSDKDIYATEPMLIRRRIGMVFQKPNPFPTMNIYDNVIAGYKLNSIKLKRSESDKIVEESLIKADLWEQVRDNLYKRGTFLSGGQQQRLCIARALAMKPDILLLDEATASLDPKATSNIEKLIHQLKHSITIVVVTHNIAQAARVSDYTAFLYSGELIEFGKTGDLFTTPKDKRTEEYLTGKFG